MEQVAPNWPLAAKESLRSTKTYQIILVSSIPEDPVLEFPVDYGWISWIFVKNMFLLFSDLQDSNGPNTECVSVFSMTNNSETLEKHCRICICLTFD